jgi:signal peptidase I
MKRRKPWLAALMSMVVPGLGQLYNGSTRGPIVALFVSGLFTVTAMIFLFDSLPKLACAVLGGLLIDLIFAVHAWRQARELMEVELKKFQRWWAYLLYAVLLYAIPDAYGLLMPTRIQSFQIPSQSMLPTLLVGDRLVADGWAYWGKDPKRGDVIVFDYPRDPKIKYVKRVIGVAGDIVELRQGELYLNGKMVPQRRSGKPNTFENGWEHVEYIENLEGVEHPIFRVQPMQVSDFGPVTVPEGQFFTLGDNRDRSNDSRVWGFVKREEILAQMRYVYFSWDTMTSRIRQERLGEIVK